MAEQPFTPGTGGDHYIPYDERTGPESTVYFTSDLSPEGLKKALEKVVGVVKNGGTTAVKLHTGEPNGPNIIPPSWVRYVLGETFTKNPPGADLGIEARIVETNTYYHGDRYTSPEHVQTLRINGWDFWPIDIMDDEGTVCLPVEGGKWFTEMSMGSHILDYDSMIVLTHFKGHTMGGFGGSNKNIGIGCADGRIGKKWIHGMPGNDNLWACDKERLMEHISESAKATVDHFKDHICFVNVMRNMSVSCDCEGIHAEPVVTPNVGILASTDICAIDQACVDIVYAMKPEQNHALVERIETRHGLRQLTYMNELGMGNVRYKLLNIDDGDKEINVKDCVQDLVPFSEDNR